MGIRETVRQGVRDFVIQSWVRHRVPVSRIAEIPSWYPDGLTPLADPCSSNAMTPRPLTSRTAAYDQLTEVEVLSSLVRLRVRQPPVKRNNLQLQKEFERIELCISFLQLFQFFTMIPKQPFFFTLLGLALLGCSNSGGPTLHAVKGTVTKGGSPLADVSVTFTPEKGPSSAGVTDASGKFVLLSQTGKAGAVAGSHKVTLQVRPKVNPVQAGGGAGAQWEAMAASRGQGAKGAPAVVKEETPFPPDYADPAKTPLKFEVESGSNDFDIPIP